MRNVAPPFALLLALALPACQPASFAQTDTTVGPGATKGGDPKVGAQIFKTNCASCHGPTGVEGGVIGPSLHEESARMNYGEIASWIEDPQPPMPHLYPKVLTLRDVRDLAAYVESL
ncbi:MAG TPA: cytochrome c [Candidatus Baltobacteraceae bacterium]|nr:cytochrome c [Candidatus Baltobacteraceae bacterium]